MINNFRVNEPANIRLQSNHQNFLSQDKLNMKASVESFYKIITNGTNVREGVVAIVSQYGSGKSFFLNILYCYLAEKHFDTTYIDMSKYEHDKNIVKTVLTSILMEHKIDRTFHELAKQLLPTTIKLGTKLVSKFLFGDDETIRDGLGDIGGDVGKYIVDIYNEEENIKKEIEKITIKTPLIIIVDNLDRCRPEFVLHFLAVIKEMFTIKNILFVLAYDKKEMINAIKTTYGAKVDVQSYIRKYIGAEYYIDRYEGKIGEFLELYINKNTLKDFKEHDKTCIKMVEIFYKNSDISLRKIELLLKIFINIVETHEMEIGKGNNCLIKILFLLFLKFWNDEIYDNFLSNKPNVLKSPKIQNLISELKNISEIGNIDFQYDTLKDCIKYIELRG
jgi:hypothetical protein